MTHTQSLLDTHNKYYYSYEWILKHLVTLSAGDAVYCGTTQHCRK